MIRLRFRPRSPQRTRLLRIFSWWCLLPDYLPRVRQRDTMYSPPRPESCQRPSSRGTPPRAILGQSVGRDVVIRGSAARKRPRPVGGTRPRPRETAHTFYPAGEFSQVRRARQPIQPAWPFSSHSRRRRRWRFSAGFCFGNLTRLAESRNCLYGIDLRNPRCASALEFWVLSRGIQRETVDSGRILKKGGEVFSRRNPICGNGLRRQPERIRVWWPELRLDSIDLVSR